MRYLLLAILITGAIYLLDIKTISGVFLLMWAENINKRIIKEQNEKSNDHLQRQ